MSSNNKTHFLALEAIREICFTISLAFHHVKRLRALCSGSRALAGLEIDQNCAPYGSEILNFPPIALRTNTRASSWNIFYIRCDCGSHFDLFPPKKLFLAIAVKITFSEHCATVLVRTQQWPTPSSAHVISPENYFSRSAETVKSQQVWKLGKRKVFFSAAAARLFPTKKK